MITASAILSGVLIGAVLGFVGTGGAMLSVPILMYIFSFSAPAATTASLAIVISAAISGLIPKIKSKDVLIREALIISAIGLITNVGFSLVAHTFKESTIKTGFSVVLIIAGSSMLMKPIQGNEKRVPLVALILISLVIGTITGLCGIGGGFLAIPILVLFFKNSPIKAAGTSLLIIILNSLVAFIAHYSSWQNVDWNIPITMAISAVLTARLASLKVQSVNPQLLRKLFAVLLYCISLFTLFQTWIIS